MEVAGAALAPAPARAAPTRPERAEVSLDWLDEAGDFAGFAFPQHRARLARLEPPWMALGARWRGVPAGLALACRDGDAVWLSSVSVAPTLRRRGIGAALLGALAARARQGHAVCLHAQWSGHLPARAALEATLAQAGWTAPALVDVQLVGLAGAMADGGGAWAGVRRAARELTGHRMTPFSLDRPGDDAAVDALLAARPGLGVPDPRAGRAEPDLSVAVRRGEALVGWVAAERLTRSVGRDTFVPGVTTINYTGARLAAGEHPALMLLAYHHAFSRQAARFGPGSRAVYRTHPGAPAMLHFTRARFAPMALHLEERLGARLSL